MLSGSVVDHKNTIYFCVCLPFNWIYYIVGDAFWSGVMKILNCNIIIFFSVGDFDDFHDFQSSLGNASKIQLFLKIIICILQSVRRKGFGSADCVQRDR